LQKSVNVLRLKAEGEISIFLVQCSCTGFSPTAA